MTIIEKHIHEHFARLAEEGPTEGATSNGVQGASEILPTRSAPQPLGPPFARVNSVVAGSPADSAGLKAEDEIRNFGYVNHTNHENLRRVGECVRGNEGVRKSMLLAGFGC
jgi:26S proteasome non-ATPase regulatory subunit 9